MRSLVQAISFQINKCLFFLLDFLNKHLFCFLKIFFFCVCLPLKTKNTFQFKKNLAWFLKKYFSFILDRKHFLEVVKNLEMSYYLLIISNLIFKFLIVIYILF